MVSEYGRAVHCDDPSSVNIHGVRADYGVTGIKAVVGTGRDKLHGGAGGGGSRYVGNNERLTTKTGWDISRN